jgi:hypothetical protein
LLPFPEKHVNTLRAQNVNIPPEQQARSLQIIRALEALNAEEILQQYLHPEKNPAIPNP